MLKTKHYTKKQLAKELGVSYGMLYYEHKRPQLDEELRSQIESVLVEHPTYGHKRIALELKIGKNRAMRVMKKFGIEPLRRKSRKFRKLEDTGNPPKDIPNLLETRCPIRPAVVWVSDFTYIKYKFKFIYLATVIDVFTREVVGWEISRYHNKNLVINALKDALSRNTSPQLIHSDQGREYTSEEYMNLVKRHKIEISMSRKSSPWQNGYQESFYSHFKLELGNVNRFNQLGELVEAIQSQIYYYNNERIHSKLKMSPVEFRKGQVI